MTEVDTLPQLLNVSKHNRDAANQVIQCVEDGTYCALLGPRFSGKTELLLFVQTVLTQEPTWCIYIDLHEVEASTQTRFFASLVSITAQRVAELTRHRLPIPTVDVTSSAVFRGFLTDSVARLERDLVLMIDHLEALPNDLLQALLTSLRAAYMDQQSHQHRLVAVVSGALSLAMLTVGESSPLRGIARRVFVGELTRNESEALVAAHTTADGVSVSPAARAWLLRATRSDPHLAARICQRCIQIASESTSRRLTAHTVKRVMREFIRDESLHYAPLQEAVRLIEDDPDLLRCILLLLERNTVLKRELPLPLSPDLDPLYLTGMVREVQGDSYQLRNEIYRQFLTQYFDPGRVGYLLTMAGRWDSAINYLEDSISGGNDQYRSDLLAATINSMYASEDVKRAAYYLTRGLSAAFGAKEACIWHASPEGNTLRQVGQLGALADGTLPIMQEVSTSEDRLEARAYREARSLRGREGNRCVTRAVPLLIPGRKPIGIVTVCDYLDSEEPTKQRERDLQLLGYLNQVARAIQEVSTRREQDVRIRNQDVQLDKKARQLSLLHRVSTLVQTMTNLEKMLNLILTGITAHFGLGFNRALLFLLSSEHTCLDGRMGIGDFTRDDAYRTWERAAQVSFEEYVEHLLKEDEIEHAAIDLPTRELHIPVSENSDDPFSRAVFKCRIFRCSAISVDRYTLPREFQQRFDPEEVIVAPLLTHGECLGIIVVDNKFSPRSYTSADEDMLATFANQAAAAIVNARQRQQEQRRRELAETLREISTVIGGSLDLEKVLELILEQMARVLPFDTASIQLLNSSRSALKIIASIGFDDPTSVETLVFPLEDTYPNARVWRRKTPLRYPDVRELFPQFADPKYQATQVCGWLGAPLLVGDEAIGVIALDSFSVDLYTPEHEHLAMLFASQAAVAIQHARLYDRMLQERKLIQTIAQMTGSVHDLERTWWLILEGAMRLTGAEVGNISLVDKARGVVSHLTGVGFPKDYLAAEHTMGGKSIQGWVAANKRTALIFNVKTDEPWKDIHYAGLPDTISELAVPILHSSSEEMVGIINLESPREGAFDEDDQRLLEALAVHADIAVQNAQLYESTRHQVQQLSLLLEAGQRIVAFRPMQEELQAIIDDLRLSLGYDIVILYVYDPNQQEFDRPVTSGVLNVPIAIGPVKKGAIVWKLVREGPDSHYTSDPAHDPLLAGPFIQREEIHASGFIRLIVNSQVVGLLFVNKRSGHHFSKQEQGSIQRFADRAAHVIRGASVLQSIVDSLHRAMGFDVVTLYLYAPKENKLSRPVVGGQLHVQRSWGPVQPDSPVWRAMQGEPAYFVNDASTDPVLAGPFVQREGVKASGYVRLEVGGQPAGILFVNWRREHLWTEAETHAVQLFATQAAIAIHNAQQYKTVERNRQQLNALHEAGKTIAEAGLEIEAVLQAILDQAVVVTGAHFGTLQLVEGDDLVFVATWPLEKLQWLRQEIGRMPIAGPGVTTRAVRRNTAQLVPDISQDPDFIDAKVETGSELAVVLQREGRPVGVLNVEHREVKGLDEEDRDWLIALANLAVVALQNAERYEELEKARDYGLASEAVAWLGLFGADWQHAINQKTFSIGNYANGLRRWLTEREATPDITNEVFQALDRIEKVVENIRSVQFTSQVPSEMPSEVSGQTVIDDELPGIVDRWCSGREDVDTILDLKCPGIKVRILPQWLRVAMEKLINNALKAMSTGGQLTLATRLVGNKVHITVKDTGPGIPDFARPYFLKRIVPRRKTESGTGMGALIARFVALSHGGDLILIESPPETGTELLMKLPVITDRDAEPFDGGGK